MKETIFTSPRQRDAPPPPAVAAHAIPSNDTFAAARRYGRVRDCDAALRTAFVRRRRHRTSRRSLTCRCLHIRRFSSPSTRGWVPEPVRNRKRAARQGHVCEWIFALSTRDAKRFATIRDPNPEGSAESFFASVLAQTGGMVGRKERLAERARSQASIERTFDRGAGTSGGHTSSAPQSGGDRWESRDGRRGKSGRV